jgi:cytochrome P450
MPARDHARVRHIAAPLFTGEAIEPLIPTLQRVVDDVLVGAEQISEFDLARDFTVRYPLQAITRVLGIPKERHEEFRQFGSAVIDLFFPGISGEARAEKMAYLPEGVAMLEEIIEERCAEPGDDFLSKFIHAEKSGEILSRQEIVSMVALMLSAGCEPPRHLINFTVLNLLRHPDQLNILLQNPALLRNAIYEAGRYDSVGKLYLPRFPLEDVEIRGVKIRKAQQVFGAFGSALRDPEAFPDPDRFDIQRDQSLNNLFGDGPHMCQGRILARCMVEAAVSTLVYRFPNMKLRGEVEFVGDTFFRKIISIPIDLVP